MPMNRVPWSVLNTVPQVSKCLDYTSSQVSFAFLSALNFRVL